MIPSPVETGDAKRAASATADGSGALDSSVAPMPTSATLRMRRSVAAQLVRFGVINLKMLRIALKSHT